MLGIIIRKLEAATRPERDRVIEQQKETIKDMDETIKDMDETIEQLRNQLRRSGHEPVA